MTSKPNAIRRFLTWLGQKAAGDLVPQSLAPPGWIDRWKTRKEPSKADLIAAYQGICYACAKLNAQMLTAVPLKLYVQTRAGERAARHPRRAITAKTKQWLDHQPQIAARTKSAVVIEEVEDHPLLELLDTVNDYLDGHNLLELTTTYLEMEGNAYWYVERAQGGILGGLPIALWVLPSHLVEAKGGDTMMIDRYLFGQGVNKRTFQPADIMHFKYISLADPYRTGVSPARAAWTASELMDRHYSYQTNVMDNRARPDALISPKSEDSSMQPEVRDRFEHKLNTKFRKGGAGGIMVSGTPLSVDPLSFPAKDMEMLAFHGISKEEVCNAFAVPVQFFTPRGNLANLRAALTLHARMALLPRATLIDQVLNQKLVKMYDPTGRLFLAHDNPVPEDSELQNATQQMHLASGLRVINEVRTGDLGLEPVEWGDMPILPFNVSPLDISEERTPPPTNGTGQVPSGEEEEEEGEEGEEPVKAHKHMRVKSGHRRRLPRGTKIKTWLKGVFGEQRAEVLDHFKEKRKDISPVDLTKWNEAMARKARPLVAIYVDEGGQYLYRRLNVPADIPDWNIQSPRVQQAIERASMRFCKATNETTTLEINEAIRRLRDEVAEGIVEGPNMLAELRKRVGGIFDNAEQYRATRIANTEASRAVHQGQWLAAKDSEMVEGFKWLMSADACEMCQAVAAEHPDGIPLDGEFAHDDYVGAVRYPPLHPHCQCTVTEKLRAER